MQIANTTLYYYTIYTSKKVLFALDPVNGVSKYGEMFLNRGKNFRPGPERIKECCCWEKV